MLKTREQLVDLIEILQSMIKDIDKDREVKDTGEFISETLARNLKLLAAMKETKEIEKAKVLEEVKFTDAMPYWAGYERQLLSAQDCKFTRRVNYDYE